MINLHHEFALVAVSDAFATTVTDLDGVFLSIFFFQTIGHHEIIFLFPSFKTSASISALPALSSNHEGQSLLILFPLRTATNHGGRQHVVKHNIATL